MRPQQKIMFSLLLILSLSVINQAQSSREATANSYLDRGLNWLSKGEKACALADYETALKGEPDNALILNNRAGIRHDKKDYTGALADYDRAIALKPDWAAAWCNRGVTRRVMGELKRAVSDYDRAIELKPDFALAYANRARAKKEQGRMDEAKRITSRV